MIKKDDLVNLLQIFNKEERTTPINKKQNEYIIQYELYTAKNNTIAFNLFQLSNVETKSFFFIKKTEEKSNMICIVKIDNQYTMQINDYILRESFSLNKIVIILADFLSTIDRELLISDYSDNESSYLEAIKELEEYMSKPTVNKPYYGDGSDDNYNYDLETKPYKTLY